MLETRMLPLHNHVELVQKERGGGLPSHFGLSGEVQTMHVQNIDSQTY